MTNKEDINVLHLAVYKNDLRIVRLLLKSGFPIEKKTNAGYNCLHLAAIMNRGQIVEEILSFLKEGHFKKKYVFNFINEPNTQINMTALSMSILSCDQNI